MGRDEGVLRRGFRLSDESAPEAPPGPEDGPGGIPASLRLAFRAARGGTTLGTHEVEFARTGTDLTVRSSVDYAVKLGFVTVYRYRLRSTETWAGSRLMSVAAETDNNGKPAWARVRRDGDFLQVDGSKSGRYRAPSEAMMASHWNQSQLSVPLINPQDGSLLRFAVTPKGPARLKDAAGNAREAQRFHLAGEDSLDLWYDPQGVWLALQAKIRDGSTVTYHPVG